MIRLWFVQGRRIKRVGAGKRLVIAHILEKNSGPVRYRPVSQLRKSTRTGPGEKRSCGSADVHFDLACLSARPKESRCASATAIAHLNRIRVGGDTAIAGSLLKVGHICRGRWRCRNIVEPGTLIRPRDKIVDDAVYNLGSVYAYAARHIDDAPKIKRRRPGYTIYLDWQYGRVASHC